MIQWILTAAVTWVFLGCLLVFISIQMTGGIPRSLPPRWLDYTFKSWVVVGMVAGFGLALYAVWAPSVLQ